MKKKTKGLVLAGILFLLLYFGFETGTDLIPFILVVGGICLIVYGVSNRRNNGQTSILPVMTKEKEAHYVESGMSEKEIEFFRETMNQTKKQILQLQENINKNAKLKAIDLRHDTLRASKAMFKELVKDPQKLHFANHFLYTHLPNMVDLTDKFIEINGHEIKTKETYEKIEESSQIIDQMAALIAKDYQQFVADDLEDLDIELSIAKQSLKRDNSL
ncbi:MULTISPECIES: 5-bromo-4-chloroindolyl phosphate hydrolysis family protein [Enterococcus]|jgi:5-bromo-4-chloroindolyl phosphate hydrolysis protein|uniref:5-bromo-4-chloroindolyl phosphate hydrolysis protein n=1 Tax=Enterococcus dispar ATCC 51266 TaxID=1139219 RepID=S1NCJ6_9ENTE|nr:5-bromo-4-chloroindolyl phosphate hydrolysis family protein [Enterococcus dispar]EOT40870.1 hypothetical protein OMK_01786 [Enterococcus dispar ATCC 51266]EOW86757.1 hypothetical protein I569_02120 [Enterococcus dispar ATCC 51266]MCU7357671.1 5-bromo-4-chloroindolyl phosphate hydrolysis family protein [Enterococcus dispar]MDT2706322.1 5-bromo-4-chloroindolyl phosphate hydrolysis family protein [Enterococcus dispar]OJG39699.1 hypothetical protein RV01_GL000881 [Enterococcus dispar]